MAQYRYIGDYAYTLHLSEGRLVNVGPGDFIDLSDEEEADEYNKRLIDEGTLVTLEKLGQPVAEGQTVTPTTGAVNEAAAKSSTEEGASE
jgi:hypothetical protein